MFETLLFTQLSLLPDSVFLYFRYIYYYSAWEQNLLLPSKHHTEVSVKDLFGSDPG
jgi:hypothetical protein